MFKYVLTAGCFMGDCFMHVFLFHPKFITMDHLINICTIVTIFYKSINKIFFKVIQKNITLRTNIIHHSKNKIFKL